MIAWTKGRQRWSGILTGSKLSMRNGVADNPRRELGFQRGLSANAQRTATRMGTCAHPLRGGQSGRGHAISYYKSRRSHPNVTRNSMTPSGYGETTGGHA